MRRLLPFPLLSASLLAMWLLLQQTVSAGHLLLGGVLALAAPRVLTLLDLPALRIRRPGSIARLFLLVAADIVRSNVAVGRIILHPGHRERRAGFVRIPLRLRDPYGLAALACIVTATPGTLWVSFEPATGILTIHVLDLVDEDDWMRTVGHRYESLLLEIFL